MPIARVSPFHRCYPARKTRKNAFEHSSVLLKTRQRAAKRAYTPRRTLKQKKQKQKKTAGLEYIMPKMAQQ